MSESVVSLVDKAAAARPARSVFVYDVPAKYGKDVESVGLIQLTGREEVEASKRGQQDPMTIVYEQVIQALVEVNGKPVGLADGGAEKAFNAMSPPVRQLVIMAYQQLHQAAKDDQDAFLKSQQIRVG